MKNVRILLYLILSGIAVASFIPHLFPEFWLADIFSHFKLQYAILLLVVLLLHLLLKKKSIFYIATTVVLFGWNSRYILPLYLEDAEGGEASGETLSILAMNLLASNRNYSEALDLIREKDPDVVVLLELSPQWEEQMQVLNAEFPFRQLYPQRDNFGIGILSKIPMASTVTDFKKGFPPSILSQLQINGRSVSVLATHPVPPVSQEMFEFRNEQLEAMANLAGEQTGDLILAGDLNTSSYSEHFKELLERGKLRDSRKGFGIASTWPSNFHILRTTLDHFLLKGDMKVLERTTERNIGSDHLPVFLKVSL